MAKLGICVLLFLVLLAIYGKVSKDGLPSGFMAVFDNPMRDYLGTDQFDDSAKVRVRKEFAGFWRSTGQGIWSGAGAFAVENRLEIKENGYAWQVVRYRITLPSAAVTEMIHVTNAYLQPYGTRSQGDRRVTSTEVRVVRQVWIASGDTCYGPSHEDTIWNICRSPGLLQVESTPYIQYDGSLDTMFPAGILRLVDEIAIGACPRATDIGALARKALSGSFEAAPAESFSVQQAVSILDRYYAPLLADHAGRQLRSVGKAVPTVEIKITVASDGTVSDYVIVKPRSTLDGLLGAHVKSWRFPLARGTREPMTLVHTIPLTPGIGEEHGPAEEP